MKKLKKKLHKYKVLVVDDEELIREGMEMILSKIFDNVIACDSGADALMKLENNPDVKIVLTDILMPNLNGIELAKKIKEKNPNIHIIFISASQQNLNSLLDFEYLFINKPISFEELFDTLRKIEI